MVWMTGVLRWRGATARIHAELALIGIDIPGPVFSGHDSSFRAAARLPPAEVAKRQAASCMQCATSPHPVGEKRRRKHKAHVRVTTRKRPCATLKGAFNTVGRRQRAARSAPHPSNETFRCLWSGRRHSPTRAGAEPSGRAWGQLRAAHCRRAASRVCLGRGRSGLGVATAVVERAPAASKELKQPIS